jgi:hypothetical protein
MDNYAKITTKTALFRQRGLKSKLKKVFSTDKLNSSPLILLENSISTATTQLLAQKGNC